MLPSGHRRPARAATGQNVRSGVSRPAYLEIWIHRRAVTGSPSQPRRVGDRIGGALDRESRSVTIAGCGGRARSADILSPLWGVSHVALRAFELRGGHVILSGVYDAPGSDDTHVTCVYPLVAALLSSEPRP
jgi:hypothetical protein